MGESINKLDKSMNVLEVEFFLRDIYSICQQPIILLTAVVIITRYIR